MANTLQKFKKKIILTTLSILVTNPSLVIAASFIDSQFVFDNYCEYEDDNDKLQSEVAMNNRHFKPLYYTDQEMFEMYNENNDFNINLINLNSLLDKNILYLDKEDISIKDLYKYKWLDKITKEAEEFSIFRLERIENDLKEKLIDIDQLLDVVENYEIKKIKNINKDVYKELEDNNEKYYWYENLKKCEEYDDIIINTIVPLGGDPLYVKCLMALEGASLKKHVNRDKSTDYGPVQINDSWNKEKEIFDLNFMCNEDEEKLAVSYSAFSAYVVLQEKKDLLERKDIEVTPYNLAMAYNYWYKDGESTYALNFMKIYMALSGEEDIDITHEEAKEIKDLNLGLTEIDDIYLDNLTKDRCVKEDKFYTTDVMLDDLEL